MVAFALSVVDDIEGEEPSSYREAVTSKESSKWQLAMQEEIESLQKNNTWKLVKVPLGQKIVGCK